MPYNNKDKKAKKAEYMRKWNAEHKDKVAEYQKKRYQRDKNQIALRQKKYREAHDTEIKSKKHEYYLANKERLSKKNKEYYIKNIDSVREYKNEYRKTPKGKYFVYQVSAKKRGHEFHLSEEEFISKVTNGCHYCGLQGIVGIDRKDSSLGYTTENTVSCCSDCNYMKRNLSYDDFISLAKKIAKNFN